MLQDLADDQPAAETLVNPIITGILTGTNSGEAHQCGSPRNLP